MEWLHHGCDGDLLADFVNFGAGDLPFDNILQKCFKIVVFLLWCRDPVVELLFLTPLRVVLLCFAIESVQMAL